MWNLNGTITTPWFGGEFVKDYYLEDKDYHMVLELPDDIKDLVGSGSLAIELEVDLREEEGWQERVQYTNIDLDLRYELHTEKKTWPEAEAVCQQEGGHLASVASEEENEALRKAGGDNRYIWLGAKQESGVMSWSDESLWGSYSKWVSHAKRDGDFYTMMYLVDDGYAGVWDTTSFANSFAYAFICKHPMQTLTGMEKIHLSYKSDQLNFSSFNVHYQYRASNQQILESFEDKRMTWFKLSWRVKFEEPQPITNISEKNTSSSQSGLSQSAEGQKRVVATPKYEQPLLTVMVQLASFLRVDQNMTRMQILNKMTEYKMENVSILMKPGVCSDEQISTSQINETFPEMASYNKKEDLGGLITAQDILTGLELFHSIVYCPVMDIKFYSFVDRLLMEENSRTIIQTFVNLFQPGVVTDPKRFKLAKEFYMALAATLNLHYGNVLLATSTRSQLQTVIDKDWPFFANNTDLVKSCLLNSTCEGIQDIIGKPGKSVFVSFLILGTKLLQISTTHRESYLFTQSTWFQTPRATYLHLLLSSSARTKRTAAYLDKKGRNLKT